MGSKDLTRLLQQARSGDSEARAALLQAAYEDLRSLAVQRMRAQRQDHTLTATALVHEVSLRLLGGGPTPEEREGFFAYASSAMRNLLVDHARERGSQKRGGGKAKLSFEEGSWEGRGQSDEILAVHEALGGLQDVDARKAQVVEMRYFGRMTVPEIAEALDVSEGTVKRDWNLARAWLKQCLRPDETEETDERGAADLDDSGGHRYES